MAVTIVLAIGGPGLAVATAAPAQAAIFTVDTAAALQSAVQQAAALSESSTITLAPGIYQFGTAAAPYLNLYAGNDPSTAITIVGAGASSTILDGGGAGAAGNVNNEPLIVKDGLAPVTIKGVTITHSGTNGPITTFRNLSVQDSMVTGNAGGIQDLGGLDLSGTTVAGNAGGVYVEADFSAKNSTISGNTGNGLDINGGSAAETLDNVTIAANSAVGLLGGDDVVVTNTIIAGNAGGDCDVTSVSARSGGHNLAGDSTCAGFFTGAGDQRADPLLGPLANNGGPTTTMALPPGSPAVDAGDDAACLPTDQRGVSRPQGAHCDIGAFELASSVGSTTTALGSSSSPSVVGQAVTFTATVAAVAPASGTPGGQVTFSDASGPIAGCGAVPLVGGQATCQNTFNSTQAGDAISAAYGGSAAFVGSSGQFTQVVNPGSTTTGLGSSVSPSLVGQAVTFTATVAAVAPASGTPAGQVTFSDASGPIAGCGAVPLVGGQATCQNTFNSTQAGDAISAAYGGTAAFLGSSGQFTQVVNTPPPPATQTLLTSSSNPSRLGEQVMFTATVSPVGSGGSALTGTVTFTDGGASIGCDNVALTSGAATCIATYLTGAAVGVHQIAAAYANDAVYTPSSASVGQVVLPITSVVASPASVTADGVATSTITVTLLDANGNPVAGKQVTLVPPGPPPDVAVSPPVVSDAGGRAIFTVSGTSPGVDTFQAIDSTDLIIIGSVNVTLLGPSPLRSTVVAAPAFVTADGVATSTITVTLLDANGNPVAGKQVTLVPPGPPPDVAVSPPVVSDAGGRAIFTVSGTSPGVDTFQAIDSTDSIIIGSVDMALTPPGLSNVAVGSGPGASATSPGGAGSVTAAATGGSPSDVVVVGQYATTPVTGLGSSTGAYFDVLVAQPSGYSSLTVTDCNLAGGTSIQWWNGTMWQPVSPPAVLTPGPCATLTVTSTSSPSLAQLTGTVFGVTSGAPPIAVTDHYATPVGTRLVVGAPGGVLANDTLNGSTIVAHTNPAHGVLTLGGDGSFTYSSARGFHGTDSFAYILANAAGRSTGNVTVDVPARADLSVALSVARSSGSSLTYTITVTNGGPDDARGVTTTLLLPPGTSVRTSSPPATVILSRLVVWSAGSLSANTSVTYTVVVNAAPGRRQTATTETGAIGSTDPNLANNVAFLTMP